VCGCDVLCWDNGRIWCFGDVCLCVVVTWCAVGSGMIWIGDADAVFVCEGGK
jgi:hypothetical protein